MSDFDHLLTSALSKPERPLLSSLIDTILVFIAPLDNACKKTVQMDLILQKSALARLSHATGLGLSSEDEEKPALFKVKAGITQIAADLPQMLDTNQHAALKTKIAQLIEAHNSAKQAPIVLPDTPFDVFLSYTRHDKSLMLALVDRLSHLGISVWNDEAIPGGARFETLINHHIDLAKAVIVLWTRNSILSDWVRYEAGRAHRFNKHIPLRTNDLDLDHVPAPYPAVLDIVEWENDEKLVLALLDKGIEIPSRA